MSIDASPTAETVLPAAAARRVEVFDGLRGIAIVLVVLSHGWILWPTGWLDTHALPQALTRSGNFGVSVFFAVGAFVSTTALLRAAASPRGLHPVVALVRRFVRLSAQLYLLLAAILVVSVVDLTDGYRDRVTRASVWHVATYTWNWYLQGHSPEARSDLGHLWYLSVDFQVFVLVLVLVHLLRRHRAWLAVALGALFALCVWWRFHVSGDELLYVSLLRTTTRMDAPVAGALAAAAVPYLRGLAPYARRIGVVCLLALVPLLHQNVPNASYFGWWGIGVDVALAGFVIGCTLATPPAAVVRVLGNRVLVWLGRWSLGIYLWHFPVFFFVTRHTHQWRWEARATYAALVLVATVWLGHRLVERRVTELLCAPLWDELSAGLTAYAVSRLPRRARRGRRAVGATRPVSASGAAAGRSGSAAGSPSRP
ncbi:MAG: acyltransferase family protein [Nocardioides sp.]